MLHVHTIGRIGKDCQVISGAHGSFMAMDIAVDDYSRGQNTTTWIRVRSNKDNHIHLSEYLTKGRLADLCISRQMYTAVQASQRLKHTPLNTYVSLDSHGRMEEDRDPETQTLAELLADKTGRNPEELFLDKERVAYLEKRIATELSELERQVLDLYITGMSYTQIAKVLRRSEKATENALTRAKQKIRGFLSKESKF